MGASSARFAGGWLDGGRIKHEVVEQIGHEPVGTTCAKKP